ncbi:MAG: DUF2271 domain-containing protein [Planctomycetota bacterium]
MAESKKAGTSWAVPLTAGVLILGGVGAYLGAGSRDERALEALIDAGATQPAVTEEPSVDGAPVEGELAVTEEAAAEEPSVDGAPVEGELAVTEEAAPTVAGRESAADADPTPSAPQVLHEAEGVTTFLRDNVLGTSFSLTLVGPDAAEAERLEGVVLAEVERLRAIFSTWDPESELSKLNALPWSERRQIPVSEDLAHVLRLARLWRLSSSGAFDGYLGELHDAWREAARRGEPLSAEQLAALRPGRGVGFELEKLDGQEVVTCTRAGRFDLDGLAKGYAVNRGVEVLREAAPTLEGGLVELGGDLRTFGNCRQGLRAPWVIGVADPRDSADNSPALAELALGDGAVASSGGYARLRTVGGQARGHILDPRSGQPAQGVLGATALAKDALTADALATALCVLEPAAGLKLAALTKAECAIVDAQGTVHTSPGWARYLAPEGGIAPWPEGYRVELGLSLNDSTPDQRFKRHGLAAWVEDLSGQRVRILALWFDRNELKYIKDLPTFWEEAWLAAGESSEVSSVRRWTRASRAPGHYTLAWDGLDDAGRKVPQGTYRLRIDVNREHGPPNGRESPTVATVELRCAAEPASAEAADQPELSEVRARYGPKP